MDINKLTVKSQEAVQKAQQLAVAHEHTDITTSHLLKGMLEADKNLLPHILNKLIRHAGPKVTNIATAQRRVSAHHLNSVVILNLSKIEITTKIINRAWRNQNCL